MSQTKVKSGLLNFPDQTDFVKLPSGTTAQRPVSPEKGYSRYNTTDNKLEFWNGTLWQQLPGVVAPIITSVSYPGDDLAADPAGGQTITINGSDFQSGATVTVGGTTPSVITFVSATQITFEAPAKASGDYDIVVTNPDGGNATAVNGMAYNGVPSWTTPAGNLGSFPAGSTIPTITLVATEPDSGVISYSVTTGALPTGLTLTGADIDGNVPTPAGETTYNFSVTASDDENQSTERAFNIVVYLQVTNTVSAVDPFGDSSGVALYRLENNANDEGGVYNGTATNVTYGAGVFGQAGVFNGSSSKIEFPTTSSTPIDFSSENFSFSFWFKADNFNPYGGLLSKWSPTDSERAFRLGFPYESPNNKIRYIERTQSSTNQEYNSTKSLNTGQWYHLAITRTSNVVNIYIDGEAETFAASETIRAGSSNSIISGFLPDTTAYFDGSIDQIRIFNRALTPLEVSSLYEERTVVCGGQAETVDILGDNSCIALYPLDGNANDLSGNYSGTPTDVSYGVGEFDLAGVFNGSSSKIELPISVVAGNVLTVSFWFNSTSNDSPTTLFSARGPSSSDVKFIISLNRDASGDGKIGIDTGTSSGFVTLGTYAGNYNDGNWHHIVGTIDYITKNYQVYIDGVSRISGNNSSIYTGWAIDKVYLGVNYVSQYINGSIDQVRIFNKALSAGEVTALYNETACDVLACSGTTNTLDILGDGSCIATYPLDGSPLDLSGNYNGVQTNVTYPVGKYDLAGSFSLQSRIETSLHFDGTTAQGASLSAWFKGSPDNPFYIVQAKTLNPSGTFLGYIVIGNATGDFTDESVYVVSRGSSTLATAVRDGHNAYLDNQWHHIVVTSTSTAKNIYIDGQSKTLTYNDGSASTNLEYIDLMIHSDSVFGGSGEIDQVRIFNKALSAGEVTTLYNETACN